MKSGSGWLAVGLAVVLSGCMTPRSGEFYQETKAARIGSWWRLTPDDGQFHILSVISVPVKLLAQGIDVFLVNPLWDTVMAPVDAFCSEHGRCLRVVDENGDPVAGAAIVVDGNYTGDGWADFTFSTETRDTGMTDEDGRFVVRRRHRNHAFFDCQIAAEGYHTRRVVLHADRAAFAPKPDAKGRPVTTLTLQHVRSPLDHPVRAFDIPFVWTQGEQDWTRGYDLEMGAWLPPYGTGRTADVVFAAVFSKAKGLKRVVLRPGESGAAFARLPMQLHCDPRFFAIDYEIPAAADFQTVFYLQCEGQKMKPEWRYDAATEYVAYRVRRADGIHVGALVPTGLGSRMRNVYNPTPGSLTLEYR